MPLLDYLFGGRAVAGLAIGALTHVIPMYLAEISSANIRGSLVSLQQLAITFGVSETTSTEANVYDPTQCRFLLAVRGGLFSYIYSYMLII